MLLLHRVLELDGLSGGLTTFSLDVDADHLLSYDKDGPLPSRGPSPLQHRVDGHRRLAQPPLRQAYPDLDLQPQVLHHHAKPQPL